MCRTRCASASNVPYAPFGYKLPSGELTGFEIELGNAICEQLATRCEWVEQDFDGIIPGLMARSTTSSCPR